jgi:hypothetical protein
MVILKMMVMFWVFIPRGVFHSPNTKFSQPEDGPLKHQKKQNKLQGVETQKKTIIWFVTLIHETQIYSQFITCSTPFPSYLGASFLFHVHREVKVAKLFLSLHIVPCSFLASSLLSCLHVLVFG